MPTARALDMQDSRLRGNDEYSGMVNVCNNQIHKKAIVLLIFIVGTFASGCVAA
jgi:hypothetical protein